MSEVVSTGSQHGTRRRWSVLLLAGVLAAAACDGGEGPLPPNVTDPATIKTPGGTMQFYRGVVLQFERLQDDFFRDVGVLADELAALPMPPEKVNQIGELNSRSNLLSSADRWHPLLHTIRAQAREARGFFEAYLPDSVAQRSYLYAIEGYADVMLADLFCSGIPMSTVDYGGDYTLGTGSTTSEVYRQAAALFDTAFALAEGHDVYRHLAAVGWGRSLLGRGDFDGAKAAVLTIPDAYSFRVAAPNTSTAGVLGGQVARNYKSTGGSPSVADHEGTSGLDYLSSADPRIAPTPPPPRNSSDNLKDFYGYPLYLAGKYPVGGTIDLVLASGIEARLIEAEAALRSNAADGRWLDILNHLRTTAVTSIVPSVSDPLPMLEDPEDDLARVDLLFRERAFWLYLTGHRQGDMRRLVRQYSRSVSSVFPNGSYPGGDGRYGGEIVLPVPESEQQYNPGYKGCINRNA